MSAHQTLEKLCVPKGLETVGQIIQGYKGYQLFKTTLDMGLFHWLNSSSPRSREEIEN